MIVIVARQVIKKECEEQYRALAAELVEASAKEGGCVSYRSLHGMNDERLHTFLEVWKDQDALDRHQKSEHFMRIVPQFGDLFDEPEQVDLYQE